MNRTLIATALAAPFAALAQPVLDQPGDAPTPGTSYAVKYAAYQAPGTSGADQTWNFASLVADSTAFVSVVAPGSAPGGTSFPSATAAVFAPDGTEFYASNSIGLFLLGTEFFGQPAPYTEPAQYLAYPCTYQTGWEGSYGGAIEVTGFPLQLVGSIFGYADGFGTLELPEGTVTNVLRVNREEITVINTFLGDFELTTSTYAFYKSGIGIPILEISTTSGEILGDPLELESLQWVDLSTVSVPEQAATHHTIQVFPNPANEHVMLRCESFGASSLTVDLIDVNGRIALTQNRNGIVNSSSLISVDLSGLASGLYLVRMTDDLGRSANGRVQIQ